MAVRPLRPATRLRLGEPLPHLLADRTRVSRIPDCSFYPKAYGVLAAVSNCCPPPAGRSSCITHPSATNDIFSKLPISPVQLACVKHAASVRPEPGSNSRIYCSERLFTSSSRSYKTVKVLVGNFCFNFRFRFRPRSFPPPLGRLKERAVSKTRGV